MQLGKHFSAQAWGIVRIRLPLVAAGEAFFDPPNWVRPGVNKKSILKGGQKRVDFSVQNALSGHFPAKSRRGPFLVDFRLPKCVRPGVNKKSILKRIQKKFDFSVQNALSGHFPAKSREVPFLVDFRAANWIRPGIKKIDFERASKKGRFHGAERSLRPLWAQIKDGNRFGRGSR